MSVRKNGSARLEALQGVFWDMDGTLIDSEPLWHEGELRLVREYGGHWTKQLAEGGSGRPVPQIAQEMADLGCPLPPEEIGRRMIQYVTDEEKNSCRGSPVCAVCLNSCAMRASRRCL